eukprot:1187168-Alexandrium_andersonii.AAC.1
MNLPFMNDSTASRSSSYPVSEVIAVHDAPDIQLRMVKAARAGFALGEPEALQGFRVQRPPARRRGSSAIQA